MRHAPLAVKLGEECVGEFGVRRDTKRLSLLLLHVSTPCVFFHPFPHPLHLFFHPSPSVPASPPILPPFSPSLHVIYLFPLSYETTPHHTTFFLLCSTPTYLSTLIHYPPSLKLDFLITTTTPSVPSSRLSSHA